MAKELARRNITANAVAPGFIDTDMTKVLSDKVKETVKQVIPCQKMGEPKDVASLALYLASPASDYVTGGVFLVDGGLNVAAAMGWAREMGAREGVLLEYTTSHDVMRGGDYPTMFVGYAAVVFVR